MHGREANNWAVLPVPAETYFADFAFDLIEYQIFRNNHLVGSAKGLSNTERSKCFISFLIGTDIQVGDRLESDYEVFTVSSIGYDTFNGEKQIINAYY